VRVTTAFNRILGLAGASVRSVTFTPEGIVVGLGRRCRRLTCPCGWSTSATYDRSTRQWRHLDVGGCRLVLEAEIRRLDCRACGRVRTERVPWARPGARHSRDFEDVVAWLGQRTDKTTITALLRVSWEAVRNIVERVVDEHIDVTRLDGLYRIGVDDVSYRKGHRYLTVVADHDRGGRVVWAGEGRDHTVLERFYDELGEDRIAQLEAISMDMSLAYKKATDHKAAHAHQCVDPFHLVKLANEALDKVRREHWQATRPRRGLIAGRYSRRPNTAAGQTKHTRWALLKDPANLTDTQLAVLHHLRTNRSALYRAWQLKEGLRDLYRLRHPHDAPEHLHWWLNWACRSRIPAFIALAKTVRANHDRILAAIELGLSNSKLEGTNSKIRLINHRGYGHHTATAIIAMIYLCCGGITITLPTQR
jgi:transposase